MVDTAESRRRNWRSLNELYTRKKILTDKYQNLIVRATQQFQFLDKNIRTTKKQNVESIKCITNTKQLLEGETTKFCNYDDKHRYLRTQLDKLTEDLSRTNQTATEVKLKLDKMKKKVRDQAAVTNEMVQSLVNIKAFQNKLQERYQQFKEGNLELNQVYESRALMSIYKLFSFGKEHLTIAERHQQICDASDYLRWRNNQLELEQSELLRRLATHAVQTRNYNIFVTSLISKFERFIESMYFLWNCISELSECHKVPSPYSKSPLTLV